MHYLFSRNTRSDLERITSQHRRLKIESEELNDDHTKLKRKYSELDDDFNMSRMEAKELKNSVATLTTSQAGVKIELEAVQVSDSFCDL